MTSLKIRLVLPLCKPDEIENEYRCNKSSKINKRLELLDFTINYQDKDGEFPDLLITSNNFFDYSESNRIICEILEDLKKELDKKISQPNIKHLILGFDISHNPYRGIPAVVSYWNFNLTWNLKTFIFELWNECNLKDFKQQNLFRTINIKGFKLTLLSCGDIQEYCHCKGVLIPESDIIIDLAHLNYGLNIRKKDKQTFYPKYLKDYFNSWLKKPNLAIIITTQITFFKDKKAEDKFIGYCGLIKGNSFQQSKQKICERFFHNINNNNYTYTLALRKNANAFDFFNPKDLQIFLVKENNHGFSLEKWSSFLKTLQNLQGKEEILKNLSNYESIIIDFEIKK